MSELRPIAVTNNDDKGQVVIDWTQMPDDNIRYDTDDKEEVEEQAQLEAKRAAREKDKAERIVWEAEEQRAHEEEERHRAEEEKEAEHKCKAEARASGNETSSEVKKVVMDPGCTHCAWAHIVCKLVIDGNKKCVACMWCNQSKGKSQWPRDGKDAEAGPKVKADEGKKQKADEEMPEPGLSQKKQAKSKVVEVLEIDEPKAGGSRLREASTERYSGLENKLKQLIEAAGLIANNLASVISMTLGLSPSPVQTPSPYLRSSPVLVQPRKPNSSLENSTPALGNPTPV
ncbi:hypothetical protein BKA82DRAFT_23341 [Pisolithus tinctorius]|uniref:Uncharacterized protein n=1 Tax=Pisolithus tinctorius Marx 270 TaxID=870435 RepID=A0A0C3PHV7_PISTI|nr:hypothetical protein BKA82DRAFT_23341 [Pisolithus tinctorius]KIO08071.1 hypothetical protein M404DRAFT_23341 [Pisolithus tinctorius Marx 270]